MPIYKFQIYTPLTQERVLARIEAITAEPESFMESTRKKYRRRSVKQTRPFRGEVVRDSFKLERAIHPRYAWHVQIHGHVDVAPRGSRMAVIMYLHPLAMLLICGCLLIASWRMWEAFNSSKPLFAWVFMFIGAVAITCINFFPGAVKARRLLETAIKN